MTGEYIVTVRVASEEDVNSLCETLDAAGFRGYYSVADPDEQE